MRILLSTSAVCLLSLCSLSAAAQTVIYQDDFEGGTSGWSSNTTENAPMIGTNFLGRFGGPTPQVSRSFTVPAGATSLDIEFDLLRFDSWDFFNAGNDDGFSVLIDGNPLFSTTASFGGPFPFLDFPGGQGARSGTTGNVTWSHVPINPAAGSSPRNLDFRNFGSFDFDQIHRFTITVNNPGTTVDLTLLFDSDQGISDESLGYDNFLVTTTAPTSGTGSPELTLTKVADDNTNRSVGDTITYTYTAENTGDVNINDVTVSDVHNGSGSLSAITINALSNISGNSSDDAVDNDIDVLAPGDSVTFTSTYTVTLADSFGSGTITNTATATGTPTGGALSDPTASESVSVATQPLGPNSFGTRSSALVEICSAPDANSTFQFNGNGNTTFEGLQITTTSSGSTGVSWSNLISAYSNDTRNFDSSEFSIIGGAPIGRNGFSYQAANTQGLNDVITQNFSGKEVFELLFHVNSLDQYGLWFDPAENPGLGWEIVSSSDDGGNIGAGNVLFFTDILEGDQDTTVALEQADGDAGNSADGTIRFFSTTTDPITQLVWRFVEDPVSAQVEDFGYFAFQYCAPDDADLVTVKTLTSASATPSAGDTVTFEIEVSNDGPGEANGVSLTDLIPAGLTATSVNGTVSSGSYDAGTGLWNLGTLANGASETLTIEGTVDAGQGGNAITNTLTSAATGIQTDPTTDGDDLTETVTVVTAGIEAVDNDFSATPVPPGVGGVTASVFDNDTLNGAAFAPADVSVSIIDNGRLYGVTINADGTIDVPTGTVPGIYQVEYEICDVSDASLCDTAIATIAVQATTADVLALPQQCGGWTTQGWLTFGPSINDVNVMFNSGNYVDDPYLYEPIERDAQGRILSYMGTPDETGAGAIPDKPGSNLITTPLADPAHMSEYHRFVHRLGGAPNSSETIIYDTVGAAEFTAYWIEDNAGDVLDSSDFRYTRALNGPGESFPITINYPADGEVFLHSAIFDPTAGYGRPVLEDYECPEPSLSMEKVADNPGPYLVGDVVTYTYTVTNDGNVAIRNVAITDTHNGSDPAPVPGNETLLTDVAPTGDSTDAAINNSWDVLAPGDTLTFTGTYTITQTDAENL